MNVAKGDRGELEARVLQGERARAAAPPDVSRQLRLTAQAEADALQQAADARTRHDYAAAASAAALAAQLAAERQRLEAGSARYEQWSADTHATGDAAGKATAELERRGCSRPEGEPQLRPEGEPQLMTGLWQQLEAAAEAVNCADPGEHQAASDAEESRASRGIADMNSPSAPKPEPRTSPENEPEQDDRAARLDKLLARSDQAAHRIAAQQAERHASSHYAARMELNAQTQAAAGQQAQVRDEAELELLRRTLNTSRTSPSISLSIRATACASLPHAQARTGRRVAIVNAKNRPSISASTARVKVLFYPPFAIIPLRVASSPAVTPAGRRTAFHPSTNSVV